MAFMECDINTQADSSYEVKYDNREIVKMLMQEIVENSKTLESILGYDGIQGHDIFQSLKR